MPAQMQGFAGALAAGNGTPAALAPSAAEESEAPSPGSGQFLGVYEPATPATGPRSPIMHLTEPPPFLRNSETSAQIGVTPRSRT